MTRPALALDPRHFGRRIYVHDAPVEARPSLGADARLFLTTFLAGFVFVSVYLG